MNKSRLLIAMGLAFILFITLFPLAQETVTAGEECRIIRIMGKDQYGGMRLEPEYVTVTKGACVIWTNWSRGLEVAIEFEDGKTCEDVTDAAMDFSLNERSCYVTTYLALGQTSSLRFMQKGSYNYNVVTKGGQKLQGQIRVSE